MIKTTACRHRNAKMLIWGLFTCKMQTWISVANTELRDRFRIEFNFDSSPCLGDRSNTETTHQSARGGAA